MALTRDILTANADLANLTAEQIAAIETLSQNDESQVIGRRIGEIYREMDSSIEESTGVKRDGDEKTYNYLKRAALTMKTDADSARALKKQVDDLTHEKVRLEKALAEGSGDEETKKSLEQAKRDLNAVTRDYTKLKTDFDEQKAKYEKSILNIKIDSEFAAASTNINFKKDFPESVTSVMLKQAVANVKAKRPTYADDGKGNQVLTFLNEQGETLRNPNNLKAPYTARELLMEELKTMGVLAEGKPATGGGTEPSGKNKSVVVDIAACKTRSEVMDLLKKDLARQGIAITSPEYQQKLNEMYNGLDLTNLPEN